MALTRSIADFADEIGGPQAGPVCVRGGGRHWAVGGGPTPDTREVRAPAGIVTYLPAEMTVRAGAGTSLAELHDALAVHGQTTVLDGPPDATLGGLLAVGRNGIRSGRHGALRDALLASTYISAEGRTIVAGGPTVKNVTGFDLCRLLVGSLGTLGLLADVTLRTRPRPPTSIWLTGEVDPFALHRSLYRPAAVLWDGTRTWVALEGYEADVAAQAAPCRAAGLVDASAGPDLPAGRWVGTPAAVAGFGRAHPDAGRWVAEIGVGIVHVAAPPARPQPAAGVRALNAAVRAQFDPYNRCNPGRDPLAV